MTKKLKRVIAVLLLIVMNIALLMNCVQATNFTRKTMYEIDYCDKVLTYKGSPVGAVYVVYEHEGKEYPAYCIEPEKIGVGEVDSYDVTISGNIQDVGLWRVVTNGYPYKTLEELGVTTQKEAYLATKQAIYCYLRGRGTENYSYIGESGRRTLNALNKILEDANKSTETKIPNTVEIEPISGMWTLDKVKKEYVSKTYKIENAAPITDYMVSLVGDNKPQGMIVTDESNNEKNTFKVGETFKVLIPSNSLNRDGEFTINVKTRMETKPVLYGISQYEDYQDYAITVYGYEDTTGAYKETYKKNTAEIKILKQEKETKKPLEGVEFQLLDKNKNAIYQSLITDSSGRITLENIQPGTYYVKEIKTLEGYVLYNEDIKVDITLNEVVNITVNNSKEKKIEVSKEETNIEVGQEETKENINQNIENNTHEKVEKEVNEKIETLDKETNTTIEIVNQTITNVTQSTHLQKLPVTGM